VRGELSREQIGRLTHGIVLRGRPAKLRPHCFGAGRGSKRWYQVVLREGRNREVRRMFEALG